MGENLKRKRRFTGRTAIAMFGALATLVLSGVNVSGFASRPTPLPAIVVSPITACGRIARPGYYEVDNALVAQADPGDCIQISAPNVSLNLNGQSISGANAGVGAGVQVMPTAANAFIEGGGATISGFFEGLEIGGGGAVAEYFNAENNYDAGVLLNRARLANIANFTANNNHLDGIRLAESVQSVVQSFTASGNNRYGVWLVGSSHDAVSAFTVSDNMITGVYLGCSMDGPGGTCPRVAPKSNFNAIFAGVASTSESVPSQEYGVAIDLGDISNRVADITAQWNSKYDLYDANQVCGKNAWFAFTALNPQVPAGGCAD